MGLWLSCIYKRIGSPHPDIKLEAQHMFIFMKNIRPYPHIKFHLNGNIVVLIRDIFLQYSHWNLIRKRKREEELYLIGT